MSGVTFDSDVLIKRHPKLPARYLLTSVVVQELIAGAVDDSQAKAWAATARGQAHKGKHGSMFELALHTGMRPEEYLGLKWGDIDLKAGTVTVQRTLVWKRWKNSQVNFIR
ncbi:MAG: tyrosine-type recombinase/integrase [Blastocatellia bacterium]